MKELEYIPYTRSKIEAFYQQIEQWGKENKFTRCIRVLETIPEEQRDYRAAFALVHALENYAIIGNYGKKPPEEESAEALLRAIDLLESIRKEGKGKAEWNMRMAYAYQYLPDEEKAIPYAKRWAELDPHEVRALMVIVECQEKIANRNPSVAVVPFRVTLNVNARLQSKHRYELEDALEKHLVCQKVGYVHGGGLYMEASGDVKSFDIMITLIDDREETLNNLVSVIEEFGVPKGSKLTWKGGKRAVGNLEGLALYLDIKSLPKDIRKTCDIKYVVEHLHDLLDGVCNFYGWWEGPEYTAFYYYGPSYEQMLAAMTDFIEEYPLCQRHTVEQIARGTKKKLNRKKEVSMKKLNSKKYPDITYKKGEELFLSPDESGLPFWFDVEEGLTKDDGAMAAVAVALDEVGTFEKTAKEFLKSVLSDEDDEYYEIVSYFMEFHRDEIDPDTVAELFHVEDPAKLSFADMVDYLQLNRFGSIIDEGTQGFIMDLNFNPKITDELMVIYFNREKQIINIAHES